MTYRCCASLPRFKLSRTAYADTEALAMGLTVKTSSSTAIGKAP